MTHYAPDCAAGTREDKDLDCVACEGPWTSFERSATCDLCVEGYVKVRDGCAGCRGDLGGLDCTVAGRVLETAPLEAGHWRSRPTATRTYRCPNDKACPGGRGAGPRARV